MDTAATHSTGAADGAEAAAPAPDLKRLADTLAAKHAAGAAGNGGASSAAVPARNKGGRRTAEEEAAAYLARHGLRAVPDDADGDPDAPAPGPALGPPEPPAPQIISPEFIRTVAKTALDGLQAMRVKQVYQAVVKLSADPGLAKELAGEAIAPAGCIDVMTLCAEEIVRKYSLLSGYTPEACLVIAGAAWWLKDQALMKKLEQIKALKAKGEAKAEAQTAPGTA